MASEPLTILGCGFTGAAAARQAIAEGRAVRATVRAEAAATPLRALGVEVHVAATLTADLVAEVTRGAWVLVGFPPDGVTDEAVVGAVKGARAVVYLSSTGVYGDRAGANGNLRSAPGFATAADQSSVWRN